MIDMLRCTTAAMAALMLLPGAIRAQAVVRGTIREDSTGSPLPGVQILVEGSGQRFQSGSNGRYALSVAAGRHIAMFRKLGYAPVRQWITMSAGDTVLADVWMIPQAAQELDTVDVTEAPVPHSLRERIVERKALGFGKFIDSTELRRSDGRQTSDLLRTLGVRLVKYTECAWPYCPVEYRAAHPTRTGPDGEPCYSTVILDGITIYRSGSSMVPPDFSREFGPIGLEAIEYYRSVSQLPLEFGGSGADCGLVVLWSRRGPG